MDYPARTQDSSSEVQGSRYAGSNPKTPLTGKSYAFLKPNDIRRKHLSSASDSDSDSEQEEPRKQFGGESEVTERPHLRGAAAQQLSQLDRRSGAGARKATAAADSYGYGVPVKRVRGSAKRAASTDSDIDDPKRRSIAPSSDSEVDDRQGYNARGQRVMSTSDSEPEVRIPSTNRLSVSSVDSATGDDDLSATDHNQSDSDVGKQLEENLARQWHDESTGDEESGVASESSRPSYFSERSSTSTSTSTSTTASLASSLGYKSADDYVRQREEKAFKNSKAQKMMEKFGYKSGEGLGKHGQGIVNPVEMSKQRGRRGFGHTVKGLEPANLTWDPKVEEIVVREKVLWISDQDHRPLDLETLETWITEGRKKLTIDDELEFCDEAILKAVLDCKTVFDNLEGPELRKARSRSNPFETIRSGIFLNRAAMKMANMDAICDFMFTRPKNEYDEHVVNNNQLLYFADVCAGPGGFSEYVLYRKKWKAKGFGFTLRGDNDFKLSDFYAGPPESFQPFYGVKTDAGEEGDGDVYNPANVQAFYEFVMSETKEEGVHFMMADGGFSVDGQENIQEILSKQLYLCQFLVAMRIVRIGGHFVCKLFDLFTSFSVGLVYLMYKSFKQISIHKPNSSRPANSERYIICKWKRDDCGDICKYMIRINDILWKRGKHAEKDIVEIVPLDVLKDDTEFYSYIRDSNNRIGRNQVIGLRKIAAFCRDEVLEEFRQAELRKESLEFWQVENSVRTAPATRAMKPNDVCISILRNGEAGSTLTARALGNEIKAITPDDFHMFHCPFEWHFCVLGCPTSTKDSGLTFFIGLGHKVFSRRKDVWVEEARINLAADTLILGEVVEELAREGTAQIRTKTLHIVDAVRLGGVDVRNFVISERHKQCALFAEAMDKPSRTDLHRVQVKELFDLETAHLVICSRQKRIKTKKEGIKNAFELLNGKFLLPGGLLFFKATEGQWGRTLSRRHQTKYYHAPKKDPVYENLIPQTHAAFRTTLKCHDDGRVWWTYLEREDEESKAWAEDLAKYVHNFIEKFNAA